MNLVYDINNIYNQCVDILSKRAEKYGDINDFYSPEDILNAAYLNLKEQIIFIEVLSF